MKKLLPVVAVLLFLACAGTQRNYAPPSFDTIDLTSPAPVQHDPEYVYVTGYGSIYSEVNLGRDRALLDAVSRLCSMAYTNFVGEIGNQIDEIPFIGDDEEKIKSVIRGYSTKTGNILLKCTPLPPYDIVNETIDPPGRDRTAKIEIRITKKDFAQLWKRIGRSLEKEIAKKDIFDQYRSDFDKRIKHIADNPIFVQ